MYVAQDPFMRTGKGTIRHELVNSWLMADRDPEAIGAIF